GRCGRRSPCAATRVAALPYTRGIARPTPDPSLTPPFCASASLRRRTMLPQARREGSSPSSSVVCPVKGFSDATRAWFEGTFREPTPAQAKAWPLIARGEHTLVCAPTGSGKTLAAFLSAIDRIATEPVPERKQRCRVLYISPLRALAVDVEKNLRAPTAGIRLAAERLGLDLHEPTVGMRTGDTSAKERRLLLRDPPDILITTPESLYLMLTSQAAETLESVETVIVDEIHAVAATKRGSHLMLSLERLEDIATRPPQRIGLSATQRPLDEIGRFLGGYKDGAPRAVKIID